jgi:RNA polymerase sigma-70 factor (ECF subfamily)
MLTVARRKLINRLKHDGFLQRHAAELEGRMREDKDWEEDFQESRVEDSMLRMFFVCCHPSLPPESQVAMTLKILCGFSVREIANALFANEAAVQKRLTRAKREFRARNLPLEIPAGEGLEARLDGVYLCIYLLFNEGYNSSHPDFLIRKDLCAEAMRLCRLVLDRFPEQTPARALMALMCLHVARFDSRIDDHGALVIFSRQDRAGWNRELIHSGLVFLSEASRGERLSEYHLEAAIAAEHCRAADFESTDWAALDRFYAALRGLKDNPVIDLNRAVILSYTRGPAEAVEKLLALRDHPRLKGYYLLHASLGELYTRLGKDSEAGRHFYAALELTSSKTESVFLREKIRQVSNRPGPQKSTKMRPSK